jgi:hypothetical protein
MYELVLIFWLSAAGVPDPDFIPEENTVKFVVDYKFKTRSSCVVATWSAFRNVGWAWVARNTPDGMVVVNASRDCRIISLDESNEL